ncbi:MAG: diguanylate cyclase [Archangiaceae bacterium]|nr:diguanylate cyclase [Archangiaceae bacterium]
MAQVLLVDDEKVARTLYSDFLTGAGHAVHAVSNGDEAKEALARYPFDLVVTDLILPNSDGMELLQFVKATYPGVEVVVITALDKVDPAVRAIKSGAADYLVKPINPEVLAHSATRALTTRSLLKENEELRRHVDLLETGQRIATTLDRERIAGLATQAFAQVCRCEAALLFVKQSDGTLTHTGSSGLSGAEEETFAALLREPVTGALADLATPGRVLKLDALPPPFRSVFLVPTRDGDKTYGAVALAFHAGVSPATPDSAPFLARHLALALRNLGRFAEVEDLVYLDDLTHLFNRRYLELVLDKDLKNATTTSKPFSLLFSDLDYFKGINDTHGHVVGSKLLVEVARVMKGCVRDNDVVCRWGGDEYVMLLRGTDSGGALKVAERIRRTIEGHHFLAREGFSINVTTCIGVASFPEHAREKDSLVDFADRAMYRGKKSTRNIIYMAAEGLEATPESRKHALAEAEAALQEEQKPA